MPRWKARVEFLLSVIVLLFLSLTVEALQGKICQNSLPSGGVGHLEPRFQGNGSSLGNILVSTKLDTIYYLTLLHAVVLTQYQLVSDGRTDGRKDGQTDRETDGFAIASTALAMRALRRAVKMPSVL